MDNTLLALCQTTKPRDYLALCRLDMAEDKLPEWVQLIPAGPEVQALDGRHFRNLNPQAVVDTFNDYPYDIPIDWEHANEIKAPNGEEAPAAGWISELEVREGSIWGRVEWTPRGAESLRTKEYRYISPAFNYNKSDLNVISITSAGLTNGPALHLADLAHKTEKGDSAMDKELLKLLGLSEDATKEQVLAAVTAHQKAKADADALVVTTKTELATARAEVERNKTPDLNQFVPREDYRVALARAESAEKQIADDKAATMKAQIDSEIEAAMKAGKVTPATKDFYTAVCSQQGGLEKFREFVKLAADIVPGSDLGDRPPVVGDKGLTEAELAVAHRCGLTKEQFLASKAS
jgi:phage I-like protein